MREGKKVRFTPQENNVWGMKGATVVVEGETSGAVRALVKATQGI